MSQQMNFTTKTRKSKHITYEERIKIEAHLSDGLKPPQIAEKLGKHRTTIEREIKLGLVEQEHCWKENYWIYSADAAQSKRDEKSSNKGRNLKIGRNQKYADFLEEKVKQKYSPYAALELAKAEKFGVAICMKTLYNYIDAELFRNITNKDLLVKTRRKRKFNKVRIAGNNKRGESISSRPPEIEARQEKGHWEIDLVVGKQGSKAVLLTLDERKTRKRLVQKLPNKKQKTIVKALKKLAKIHEFKTITADNGTEFLDFKAIEKVTGAKVYYAHPFSSWERGTNENGNRMVRRFYPKGTIFTKVLQAEIDEVVDWINNYPRKILEGRSSNEAYAA